MKAADTLIAWTDFTDVSGKVPPGSIAVGPLLRDGEGDWTDSYGYTGGAAHVHRRSLSDTEQATAVFQDYYMLVYSYGLHPYVVHRAFLHIDEYQEFIKSMGAGPDLGELGHDPSIMHGRSVAYPLPSVSERHIGRSFHFWPAAS
ncbi:MAG: hypothetical protein KIS73_05170 [Enhydrobacter sp.]|nr:hypothetical protein [Enhydrobacter sp.]